MSACVNLSRTFGWLQVREVSGSSRARVLSQNPFDLVPTVPSQKGLCPAAPLAVIILNNSLSLYQSPATMVVGCGVQRMFCNILVKSQPFGECPLLSGGPTRYVHLLTLKICERDLIWKKGLCRCD